MKTISQVAKITGISTRTLQYYDEIDLLKPSETTDSGYRLYNDEALEKLQQILFFKELGFQLKEIKEILEKPDFDKIKAFKKQKELLYLRRNRTDRLISLLDRLEKGETCMSFKEFDLSEYIEALETFKISNSDDVMENWGSIEKFEDFIQRIRDHEAEIAKMAITQFGSIERYTEVMKYNLEHFSEIMLKSRIDQELYKKLTADLTKDVKSEEIQSIVHEIINFSERDLLNGEADKNFWDKVIEGYSRDEIKDATEKLYGEGSAEFIAEALKEYMKSHKS